MMGALAHRPMECRLRASARLGLDCTVAPMPEVMLSSVEVRALLGGVPATTCNLWMATGRAPTFVKYPNGRIMFRPSAVEAWLEEHTVPQTDY
jgi:predicted DNA-binding transcriptional regulator AlpA